MKNIFKYINLILKKPKFLLYFCDTKNLFRIKDDDYLKLRFEYLLGKKLDLSNPQTFNEKLQWLKLYDRKDYYTKMVDKYEAKKYVANIIGERYIIPTLGIYDNFDEIDFDKLPNKFVLKCTHDSASIVIVNDKNKTNIRDYKDNIDKCLKKNYYYSGREWPYKNVKPRIIIEKYMEDVNTKELRDYKFFCFNGIPKIMYISSGSHTKHQKIAFFDMNYKQLDLKRTDYEDYKKIPECPKGFEKMKKLASLLSSNIPHVRVDFYEVGGNIYFGELTFYTCSGYLPFVDEKWNKILGEWINLPNK